MGRDPPRFSFSAVNLRPLHYMLVEGEERRERKKKAFRRKKEGGKRNSGAPPILSHLIYRNKSGRRERKRGIERRGGVHIDSQAGNSLKRGPISLRSGREGGEGIQLEGRKEGETAMMIGAPPGGLRREKKKRSQEKGNRNKGKRDVVIFFSTD